MDSRHIALAFAISKVDASARIVEGYATVGVRDRQGDIIPLSTAVAAFTANAETLGIREMHQPKAVGRLEGWWKDENADAVYVRVWLSESRDGEDAWLKVQEGILRGFSIGGRAKASHREGDAVVVDELELYEISLVDVPANPQALISVVKAAGAAEADQPAPSPAAEPQAEALPGAGPGADAVQKVARKEGRPESPPKGYPTDPADYADGTNWFMPLDTKARITSAMSRYNGGQGKDENDYSDAEWATIGRKIASRASDVYDETYQLSDGKVQPADEGGSVKKALDSFNGLRDALCEAIKQQFGCEDIWIDDFGPDWAVYDVWTDCDCYYRVTYQRTDAGFLFGAPVEVETTYVPVTKRADQPVQEAQTVDSPILKQVQAAVQVRELLKAAGTEEAAIQAAVEPILKAVNLPDLIAQIQELMAQAGEDPEAIEQARSALSVAQDMASQGGSAAEGTMDGSASDSTSGFASVPSASTPSVLKAEGEPAADAEGEPVEKAFPAGANTTPTGGPTAPAGFAPAPGGPETAAAGVGAVTITGPADQIAAAFRQYATAGPEAAVVKAEGDAAPVETPESPAVDAPVSKVVAQDLPVKASDTTQMDEIDKALMDLDSPDRLFKALEAAGGVGKPGAQDTVRRHMDDLCKVAAQEDAAQWGGFSSLYPSSAIVARQ